MKLNTDGSSLGNPGLAAAGGLIRDGNGSWVVGFTRKIGVASSFVGWIMGSSGWAAAMFAVSCSSSNYWNGC